MKLLPKIFVVIYFHIFTVNSADYCSIHPSHTMCLHTEVKPGSFCPPDTQLTILSKEGISLLVRMHNYYRAGVANGKELPNSCPKGSDMKEMQWDGELARIAHRWAMQCNFRHDENRDVLRFKVGQNSYMSHVNGMEKLVEYDYIVEAVSEWYNEVKHMNKDLFDGSQNRLEVGHFSQMVWSNSQYLGCGIQTWYKEDTTSFVMFCNYGPAGNYKFQKMYSEGLPCSRCPTDSPFCSDNNPGLCVHRTAREEEFLLTSVSVYWQPNNHLLFHFLFFKLLLFV